MQSFNVASATEANTLCFVSCFQEEIPLLVLILYSRFWKILTCFFYYYLFENQSKYKRMYHDNSCITLTHPFVLYFLFFLMTAMASTSMFATCMSFPVVMLMVRTLHIRIILKCFIDKSFYRFICIS